MLLIELKYMNHTRLFGNIKHHMQYI